MRVKSAHLQDELFAGLGVLRRPINPAGVVASLLDVREHVIHVSLQPRIVGRVEDHVEIAHRRLKSHDLGKSGRGDDGNG